jgi:hypothetical protein
MTVVKEKVNSVVAKLFPESEWTEIADRVGSAFRMTEEEKRGLAEGRIAKLIAATPFLAGCEEARRTAVAHLGVYLLSIRPETKPCFNSRPGDDGTVLERLRLISDFKGGDKRIIERGLNLLALNMVSDYKRDIEEDERLGKYNPVATGAWDFKELVAELEYKIACVECPEMDAIMSIEMIPFAFWGW